jgi:hypothetical protein
MIAEAIDVALQAYQPPSCHVVAESFIVHAPRSGLLAIKDAVLVAREFSEDRFRK